MQTTAFVPSIDHLRFLADPNNTKKETLKTLDVPTASFNRIDKDGKLAISYPYKYEGYQAGKHILWHTFYLDNFQVCSEGSWKCVHNVDARKTELFRHPFLFERSVVKHEAQLVLRSPNENRAQRIEKLILDENLIQGACGCSKCSASSFMTGQSKLYSAVDLCAAINKTTGKVHLLVLEVNDYGHYTVTSYSPIK